MVRRLRELSRRAHAALAFDAAPIRDAKTGTFTARGTIDPKKLRKAWSAAKPPAPAKGRDSFKTALVSALRAPRA